MKATVRGEWGWREKEPESRLKDRSTIVIFCPICKVKTDVTAIYG